MDPVEFRLLNGAKEGTRRITGLAFRRVGFLETLQAAQAHPHYQSPLVGPNKGRGVAAAVCANISRTIRRRAELEPRRDGQPG